MASFARSNKGWNACNLAVAVENDYDLTMVIEIQDESLRGLKLTKSEAVLDFAIGLFTDRRITLGRAAEIAGSTQSDFQRELGRRGIPIHYDVADLQADLQTLSALREK